MMTGSNRWSPREIRPSEHAYPEGEEPGEEEEEVEFQSGSIGGAMVRVTIWVMWISLAIGFVYLAYSMVEIHEAMQEIRGR